MSYLESNKIEKTNFSATTQTLVLDVAKSDTARFEISGTYAFTLVFEATNDGTTWFPFEMKMTNAATLATSHATANATQAYQADTKAVSKIRVRCSAFTSAGAHKVLLAGDSE